jgi:hypothetical protein
VAQTSAWAGGLFGLTELQAASWLSSDFSPLDAGIVRKENLRQGFYQEVFCFPFEFVAFIKHLHFPLDKKIKKIST